MLSAEQACSLAPHTAPAVLDRFSRLPSVLPIIACRHSSRHQDSFYAKNLFLNYGDLAENVKALLDAFQAKTNSSKSISSIADMQAFVESYPEFRKLSGDVSKHVTLLGEINRLVDQGALMEVHPTPAPTFCSSSRRRLPHALAFDRISLRVGHRRPISVADRCRRSSKSSRAPRTTLRLSLRSSR